MFVCCAPGFVDVVVTLSELSSIVEYHHVADEVDQPIRDG